MPRTPLLAILLLAAFLCGGCSTHTPVPPGTIPVEQAISQEDEQYGHEVLGELSQQYPLDRNDAHINRVRDIVDKITEKGIGSKNPWHVYVLISPDFKNAAATRGGYIFVWTGLLDSLQSDDELATVLAHEIGHVLAGHTAASPTEEATEILSGAAGSIASEILQAQGLPGIVGELAGELLKLGIQAVVVQPGQRSKELEADVIGMFLLAKSGINPEAAVDFWSRVKLDPDFSNSALTFLSTHPSSEDRLELLKQYLPEALEVYRQTVGAKSGIPKKQSKKKSTAPAQSPRPALSQPPALSPPNTPDSGSDDHSAGFALGSPPSEPVQFSAAPPVEPRREVSKPSRASGWRVEESSTDVFESASESAAVVGTLSRGTAVTVDSDERRWLRISAPVAGYVRSRDLSPLR